MTPIPESQQAALNLRHWRNILQDRNVEVQTVAEVLAAGSGSVNLLAVLEAAEKLLTPAPVDVSHAALEEIIAQIIYDSVSEAACIGTQPFDPTHWHWKDTAAEILATLRAHPAGGVSEPSDDVIECALTAWDKARIESWNKLFGSGVMPLSEENRRTLRPLMRDALRAAGIGAGVVPEGWKLVPEKPTQRMRAAGQGIPTPGDIYKAMLAAAPSHGKGQ